MVSDSSVSTGSSGNRTKSMPASSTTAERIGSSPFMIIVWTAKLSAVTRYMQIADLLAAVKGERQALQMARRGRRADR